MYGMDEPVLNFDEDPPEHVASDGELLEIAIELKAALAEFRHTVMNSLEQKRKLTHIREPVWLNSREAQQLLRICNRTLGRYRQQHLIDYVSVNRNYLYRFSELTAFMEKKMKANKSISNMIDANK